MTEESTPTEPRKRLTFDPTVNAGHLLTFASMVIAVVFSWNLLDKRVTIIEQAQQFQRERDTQQDQSQVNKYREVTDALADIKRGIEELRRDQLAQARDKGR